MELASQRVIFSEALYEFTGCPVKTPRGRAQTQEHLVQLDKRYYRKKFHEAFI